MSYAQAVAGLLTPITVQLSLAGDPAAETLSAHDGPDLSDLTVSDPTVDVPHAQRQVSSSEESTATVHQVAEPTAGAHSDRLNGLRATVTIDSEGADLVEPWHFGVDVLTDPVQRSSAIRLNRTELLQMTAQAVTTVRIRLETADDVREVAVDGPTVLAARQWRFRDSLGSTARTLATFVQPQQTELPALWRQAADHLRAATGSDSLNGYQAGAERVDATVQALCDAIIDKDIAYSAPPTNWSDEGQRIRTAEEVLDGRLATCLDTTILMAGALEYIDIQPIVLILDGHAFLGYWRSEQHGPESLAASGPSLINHVDRGEIGLVETTVLTGAEKVSLADLHRKAREEMRPNGSAVLFAVSVHEARDRGVPALPARGHDESGQVVETSYQAASRPILAPEPDRQSRISRAPRRPKGPAQVEKWKRQLLDLSLRNRLINCPDSTFRRHSAVRLSVPNSLIGAFEDLISDGTSLSLGRQDDLTPSDDETFLTSQLLERHTVTTDLTDDSYDAALQKIASDTRTLLEETGSNNLFLTIGSLVWRSSDRDLRSPLILIPVELHRGSRKSPYSLCLDQTGSSTPNFSLLERLSVDLGLQIPGLEDPEEDSSGINVDGVLDAVRRALIENGLDFHVEPTVSLGLFKFGGFRLWKDLEESWQEIAHNPLVHHLIESPKAPFVDPNAGQVTGDLDELVARLPIPADSSQAQVVAEALAGHTLVVEGPPGTGKSQTITNLIVRAIADGKRVLFVAEKQAALEVVTRRLRSVGVSDLVLNLHDRDQRPQTVREKLRRAVDLSAAPDREGIQADWARLRSGGGRLRQYRHELHDPVVADLSYFTARTRLLARGQGPILRMAPGSLSAMAVGDVTQLQKTLPDLEHELWSQDLSTIGTMRYLHEMVDPARLPELLDAVDEVRSAFREADPAAADAVRTGSTDQLSVLGQALGEPLLTSSAVAALTTPQWHQQAADLSRALAEFDRLTPSSMAFYRPDVLGGPLDEVRANLVDAKSAMFGKVRKSEKALAPLAIYSTGRPTTDDPQILLAMVDELVGLRHQVEQLVGLAGRTIPVMLQHRGGRWDPLDPPSRDAARSAIEWHRTVGTLHAAPGSRPTPFQEVATSLLDAADRRGLAGQIQRCQGAMSALAELSGNGIDLDEVLSSVPVQGDRAFRLKELRTRNEISGSLSLYRRNGLNEAIDQILSREINPSDVGSSFERGLATAALSEAERRASFDTFSPAEQTDTIDGYLTSTTSVREELPELLIDQTLRSHRPALNQDSRRFAALKSDIHRKRGRGRTIRSLFAEYGDLISHITPCVLVSPDSVARFIPAQQSEFDLVVFDEASQITVASAVGAMGRGHAVIVCGDSHQMPPTSFAQLVRDDEFSDDEELADEESILGECAAAQVPRHWLSWHYRSQVESLISFSNEHYYDRKLSSFPSPLPDGRDNGPAGFGILSHRVNGQFIHSSQPGRPRGLLRTNPAEADAIVADIRRRFEASPDALPSIGVVTFNAQQRDLIETKLRDLDDPRITASVDALDGLFIKNLENVQGDERDSILFSVAFSPDENGNVPLNFGPLNRPGGERRLNVAITRARRQVVMFSSFDPSQLRTDRSRSTGLRHLKEYLELALNGRHAADSAASARSTDRHTADIAASLRAAGLHVQTDVGMSDFKIDLALSRADEPDVPLVAVLLDGPSWNGRKTVYDRDLLPTTVLAGMMGWPDVERVWMPEWLNDRQSVIERLVAAVHDAVPASPDPASPESGAADAPVADASAGNPAAPATPVAPPAGPAQDASPEGLTVAPSVDLSGTAPRAVPDLADPGEEPRPRPEDEHLPAMGRKAASSSPDAGQGAATGSRLTEVAEFRPWAEHVFGDRAVLEAAADDPEAQSLVHRAVQEICAAEFPMREARLRSLVGRAFGFHRVQGQRIQQINGLLHSSSCAFDDAGFVWDHGTGPEAMTGYRLNSLAKEGISIEDLHPVELANLVTAVRRRSSSSATREDLIRAALSALGGRRLTQSIRSIIGQAVDSSAE
ncbi:DUF4011 domain-containing protein [Acidipropionibacterium jensenii]|uniref:DUF4011 domain-containing protein n=1 Tax=Acidipropionibacterium jensenii TaxID=1749 RepID=A0A3Q9UKM9_9ACTN|nr:DUF4011 domain-containing protein [Acidipropionibacterium jensenii]